MARMTLDEACARSSTVDRAKLDATNDADIARYQIEDGYDPDAEIGETREVLPPRMIRLGLGMTQREFAGRLRIPLGTYRNWEQNRVALDPAARSLLDIMAREPDAVRRALAPGTAER